MNRPVHPSDLNLAAFADGRMSAADASEVSGHLDACATCRLRLGGDRGAAETPEGRLGPAAEVGLPEVLRNAMADQVRPPVEADQLWLASLEAQMSAVLIVDAVDDYAVVVPVTFDTEMADEYTLVVDAADNPLKLPLALWVGLRTVIAVPELEYLLADAAELGLAARARSVYERYIDGEPTGEDGVGMPILELIDPRSEYREQLMRAYALLPPMTAENQNEFDVRRNAVAAEETTATSGEDLKSRVVAVIKEFDDQILQVQDMWAAVIEPSIYPLESARLIDVVGLRIRMCVVPGEPSLRRWNPEEAGQALDVALLMRDCEVVGVTADNDELETTFVTAWDLHPAHVTRGGTREEFRWHPESALPLRDALTEQLETYLPPSYGPTAHASTETEPIDALARRNAQVAVAVRQQTRPRIEDKRVALESLDDTDVEELARIVTDAVASGAGSLSERLQNLAGADR